MSHSGAPSTACSPTKSSRWSNSPRLDRAKPNSKTMSLFVSTKGSIQKNPSASFFKNYNLTPSANKPKYSVDLAILHESRIFKNLVQAAEKKKQQVPKRNPISQDNGEETHVFKSSIRRLASADRVSRNVDEDFRPSKKTGEYNHVYNPQPQEEKTSSIRTFRVLPPEGNNDDFIRSRKLRCTSSDNLRNPICDGDEKSAVFKRWRKAVPQEDEHKRLNDKKYLLSAERGCSPKGKVFRDMTLTLGDYDYGTSSKYENIMTVQTARPVTAHEQKMRGSIKDTITYESNQNFRADKITEKINRNDFATVVQAQENSRVFGRKITLH